MALFVGLCGGALGGLLGIGGGIVMIPMMTLLLGLSQKETHGTSLVAVIFTGIIGALTYAMHGTIDYIASLTIVSGAAVASSLGARYCNVLADWKLKRFFGYFLLFTAMLLLIKSHLPTTSSATAGISKVALLVVIGIVSGFLSGLLGVGGGGIMVVGMVVFAGISQVTAQGTALLAIVPSGVVGSFTHWRLQNVATKKLPWLVAGVLVGTFIGGSFANIIQEEILRALFIAILVIMALNYIRTRRSTPTVNATVV